MPLDAPTTRATCFGLLMVLFWVSCRVWSLEVDVQMEQITVKHLYQSSVSVSNGSFIWRVLVENIVAQALLELRDD